MVKYTIEYDLHSAAMYFLYKFNKKLITCFQIFFIRHSANIACGIFIRMLRIVNDQIAIFVTL